MADIRLVAVDMENADPAVLVAADEVCPSNEDDGVLVTLERLLGM